MSEILRKQGWEDTTSYRQGEGCRAMTLDDAPQNAASSAPDEPGRLDQEFIWPLWREIVAGFFALAERIRQEPPSGHAARVRAAEIAEKIRSGAGRLSPEEAAASRIRERREAAKLGRKHYV